MKSIIVIIFALSVMRDINAKCCGQRQPCIYEASYCPETPSGIVSCPTCNNCNVPTSNALCNCGVCSNCFKDTKNPCKVCEEKTSPVCSCLASLEKNDKCNCGCEAKKSFVYFPEVAYPMTVLEMNPFYYSNCYSY